jgi:hypothetical protein
LPPTPAIDHIVGAATPFALHRTKWKPWPMSASEVNGRTIFCIRSKTTG